MTGGGGFDFRDIIKVRTKWRQALVRDYESEARRLLDAYTRTRTRITPARDLLLARMTELEADKALTVRRVRGLAELERLIDNVTAEMDDFAVILRDQSARLQASGITAGTQSAAEMVRAGSGRLSNIVMNRWMTPDPEMLRSLINYVDSEAMQAKFAAFGSNAGKSISDTILTLTAQGKNPRAIAQALKAWDALPYAWAENTARTVQQYSYRQATSLNYRANSDVVEGWVWYTALDDRTCFPAGTLITTARGQVPIEDVRVGDRVLTHTGKYQRVTELIRRKYNGKSTTLRAGNSAVTMTSDHPVLVKRGGVNYWVSAGDCKVGDVVFLDINDGLDNAQHLVGDVTVEGRGGHADNAVSLSDQPLDLTHIGFFAFMPVGFVNLYREIARANVEVRGIAGKAYLLLKRLPEFLKAKAEVGFRFGLSRVFPITRGRTKLLVLLGNSTELLAASWARLYDRRAITGLRAVSPFVGADFLGLNAEFFTAPFADLYTASSNPAFERAVIVPVGVDCPNGVLLAAGLADLGDKRRSVGSVVALPGTELSGFSGRDLEGLSAVGAGSDGALVLRGSIARLTTVDPSALSDPGVGNGELFTAVLAGSFSHAPIVSNVAHQIQCEVYNFEVENDHTYVANGLLVHNCPSCISMHGTRHTNDEILNDHHRGRCVAIGIVTGSRWADEMETGEQWFARQPDSVQRGIMGKGMHAAYKAGDIDFGKLSTTYNDPVYGEMRRAATLKELGISRTPAPTGGGRVTAGGTQPRASSNPFADIDSGGRSFDASRAEDYAPAVDRWGQTLKPGEIEGIKEYVYGNYRDMRGISSGITEGMDDALINDTKNLLSALDRAPRVDGVVWRGYRDNADYGGLDVAEAWRRKIGTVQTLPGVSSTSINPGVAVTFSDDDAVGLIFEIAQKNARYIGTVGRADEFEAIIMPGARFRVVDVLTDTQYPTKWGDTTTKLIVRLVEVVD